MVNTRLSTLGDDPSGVFPRYEHSVSLLYYYYGRLSYPALKANRHKCPISIYIYIYIYIYICSNVETEAPFIRIRIFLKPHEISESLAHPRPIRIKSYNVSKISGSCGRAGSAIDLRTDKHNRQKQKQKDKTHIWLD